MGSIDTTERYSRHFLLKEIGEEGQQKLAAASVLIVGVGGLGSPIALYLAAAGVGHIGLIDHDTVSLSNLQRQVLYKESEVGQTKATQAKQQLQQLNSQCKLEVYPYKLEPNNALRIIEQYDIVVDGCDNFDTRYLIDTITQQLQKPYVYGSIGEFSGQISVFNTQGAGTYTQLYPTPPTTMPSKGVIGTVPGVVGTLQATEVIKLITGAGAPLIKQLLVIDLATATFTKINL